MFFCGSSTLIRFASVAHTLSHRFYTAAPLIAAANSVYLTALFLRGFFYERHVESLVADFTLPFYTLPIIFLTLYTIRSIRQKMYMPEKGRWGIFLFLTLPLVVFFVLMLGTSVVLLWLHIADSAETSVKVVASLLIEIIGIAFAAGAQRTRRLAEVFKLLFLWGYSLLGALCVAGFFEEINDLEIPNDFQLVFAGIFFHAANSIYLVYAGVLGYQRAQKKRVRRPVKQAA